LISLVGSGVSSPGAGYAPSPGAGYGETAGVVGISTTTAVTIGAAVAGAVGCVAAGALLHAANPSTATKPHMNGNLRIRSSLLQ
jgi:hypothetical protein